MAKRFEKHDNGFGNLPLTESGLAESIRGFVSAWECDKNNHWNTRFYSRAFQTATETMAAARTGVSADTAVSQGRHVRFRQELLNGETMRMCSGWAAEGALAGNLVGRARKTV